MKVTDIVNHAVSTISNCESEPIHIPGSIQPHGALLSINQEFIVEYCSANCYEFILKETNEILQKPLNEVSVQLFNAVTAAVNDPQFSSHPTALVIGDKKLEAIVTENDLGYVIELEKAQHPSTNPTELFDQTIQFVRLIERSKSLQDLCQNIALQTKDLTGYDRVMIYRFDKDYNGEVYAESKEPGLPSFLGLHYPHTDIPAQARELYLRNLLRMIVNVDYTPVPILTQYKEKPETLDLSDVGLRSVSPIHIQYLKNMNVGATLTISLILDGKLWGLIACHNSQPLHLSFAQRRAALLQGHFLTSQIKVRQVAEEYDVNIVVEAHLQQLLNKINVDEDFDIKFEQFTSLLSVANASGVIILHGGEWFEKGSTPPRERAKALVDWLAKNISGNQFCTAHLKQRYPEAESISKYASGIIYQALGKPTQDCIIWFREELERTVNWAGNPHDAVKKDSVTNKLTPRSSFAIWKERVRYYSKEWRVSEVNAATRFATALQNHFHSKHLQQEELRQRVLNEKLLKANEELANINWITTHDLKEPLRKIQLFSSRVVSDENISKPILQAITKINSAAKRMQHLVDDILSYSLLEDKKGNVSSVDLNDILQEVIEEYHDEIQQSQVSIEVGKLPTVEAIAYQMRQLFTNLIQNSIKFKKADTESLIKITCTKVLEGETGQLTLDPTKDYYKIQLSDNGIGFDQDKSKKIFEIFYRLNSREAYSGTGIGLAICKKIAENHHGLITAEGQPGVGANFNLYLPK